MNFGRSTRRLFRPMVAGAALTFAALGSPAAAESVEVHYAPVENLEHIDVAELRSARTKIDMAAFSLNDWPVIDALIAAKRRGVAVRVVLDPSEQHAMDRLSEIANNIRMKAAGPYMHLKAFAVDGGSLRTGSANFSASGLKLQDNDLILIREPGAVRAFEARFEQIWAVGKQLDASPSASKEPSASSSSTPARCKIKGNVSRDGARVFHVPGDRNYDRVRMDKGLGERWFCSEAQALAAGWLRSK